MTVRGAPLIGADRRLRPGAGHARATPPTPPGGGLDRLLATPADRGEPALGARADARACSRRCARASARDAAYAEAARIADEDVATCEAIGEHGAALIREPGARGRARPRQRPDPLQRRLAGDGRLGHGARADLQGARRRHAGPRLGRRDAAAQPGRQPHRLGAGWRGRAAHGDRRQRRRPPDAARPGRPLHRRHRPHDPRPATSATRSAPI